MFQVRIHGRCGRGEVVTAAELLSVVALVDGRHTQASRGFGSRRAGAPVVAFCRITDVAIRQNEPVMDPDALNVQDTTLLPELDVSAGIKRNGYVVLNSELGLPELRQTEQAQWRPLRQVAVVPASQLAMRHTGRPVPTAAMLGGHSRRSPVWSRMSRSFRPSADCSAGSSRAELRRPPRPMTCSEPLTGAPLMVEQIAGSRAIAAAVAACRPEVVCAHPILLQPHVVEAPVREAFSQTPVDEDGSEA